MKISDSSVVNSDEASSDEIGNVDLDSKNVGDVKILSLKLKKLFKPFSQTGSPGGPHNCPPDRSVDDPPQK